MPYITLIERKYVEPTSIRDARNPGELNYQLTVLIRRYWANTKNYQGINDIVGALEGAKLEFYRRTAVDYEAMKCVQNGDLE